MYIYKITNTLNDKVYIGQCVGSVHERFNRHFSDAKAGLDTHFSRACRKYDKNLFKVETIDTAETREELNNKEKYWIKHFDSCHEGYNSTVGGDGGNTYINKTEEEMAEIKEKIRKSKRGELNPNAVKIKAKNILTGEEKFYPSMRDATADFQLTRHNPITKRVNNRITCAYEEEWCFAYADQDYLWNTIKKGNARRKNVEVINPNNLEVVILPTHQEAVAFLTIKNE